MMNDPVRATREVPERARSGQATGRLDIRWLAGQVALPSSEGMEEGALHELQRRFEAVLEAGTDDLAASEEAALRTSLQDVVDLLAATLRGGTGLPPVVTVEPAGARAVPVRGAWTGTGVDVSVDARNLSGALSSLAGFSVTARPGSDAPAGAGPQTPAVSMSAVSPDGDGCSTPGPATHSLPRGVTGFQLSDSPDAKDWLGPLALPDALWGPAIRPVMDTAAAGTPASAPTEPAHRVWRQVEDAATRMTVLSATAGNPHVRLDIDPRVLPGVQVVMQFAGGRLQVEFICAFDASRRNLRAVAQRELGGTASRLGVDLLMKLRADGADEGEAEYLHAAA